MFTERDSYEKIAGMWLIPLILLVAVAIHHRLRIYRLGQTPWKGGSFSMFSEISQGAPVTEITVRETQGGVTRLRIVGQGENPLLQKAAAVPTEKNSLEWARAVNEMEWKRCGNFAHAPLGPQESTPMRITEVIVRYRRVEFDIRTGRYSAKDFKTFRLDLPNETQRASQ
ncbi:hypothetical protein FBR05_09695 [Deltaproteobacteria bacterium PRO3]|nr:hypothetical protein [Deltaproteobacteria bacterium PRO3]